MGVSRVTREPAGGSVPMTPSAGTVSECRSSMVAVNPAAVIAVVAPPRSRPSIEGTAT